MRAVVLEPMPPEVTALIETRRRLGQDTFDELWEGTYHMAPAPAARHGRIERRLAAALRPAAEAQGLIETGPFNLGDAGDYRVPDGGYYPPGTAAGGVYVDTCAVVVEIVSPGDETFDKLPFYARRGVAEVIVVDPDQRRIRLLALAGDSYAEAPSSSAFGVDLDVIASTLDWT